MQQYELMGGKYEQTEMLEFDEQKLSEAKVKIGSNIPEFLKDRHREEITRLEGDIIERTNLILNM